jgi:hypothetical protein
MPDVTGIWEYEISASDTSFEHRGAFECAESDIPGMLSVYEDNPIWFGYRDGGPAMIRSLHIGDRFFADRDNKLTGEPWNDSLRLEFLDWAQKQGYNMLSIASHYLNRQQENRGMGWNTPDLWDEQKREPNPEEYRRMEQVLDELHKRRILVYPFAGFFGRGSDFPPEEAAQDLYIRYTLARLGAYYNLLYMVGGPEPLLPKHSYLTGQEVDRLARKIKEEDPYGHLLSVHNPTGDDKFIHYPWNDYGILQGPKTTDRKVLSQVILKNHHPGRPLYMQETLWPGNTFGHPGYTMEDIRRNALVIMLSGGTINFGDMEGSSSSGFSGTINLSRRVQERHDMIHRVWDFFQTLPFYHMKPRQDLVNAGTCLAEEGKHYLIYLEEPNMLNLKLIPGKYSGKWIDARDFTGEIPTGKLTDTEKLIPPQNRGDWLLYIRRDQTMR